MRVGVTGKPALSNDEMIAAFRDSETRARAGVRAHARAARSLAFLRVGKPLLHARSSSP